MQISDLINKAAARLPRPIDAKGSFWSIASSVSDQRPGADKDLLDILLRAASSARDVDLTDLAAKSDTDYAEYLLCWPGEHYRLLAGLVQALRPKVVVEIGTFLGHSALTLLQADENVQVVTFDVVPWREQQGTLLTEEHFADGRLSQIVGDVSAPDVLAAHILTLRSADFIFVDGPKDGVFEQKFAATVLPLLTDRRRIVGFDDIRMVCMAQLWRDLPFAKIDATSFGHWSGTGLIATTWMSV